MLSQKQWGGEENSYKVDVKIKKVENRHSIKRPFGAVLRNCMRLMSGVAREVVILKTPWADKMEMYVILTWDRVVRRGGSSVGADTDYHTTKSTGLEVHMYYTALLIFCFRGPSLADAFTLFLSTLMPSFFRGMFTLISPQKKSGRSHWDQWRFIKMYLALRFVEDIIECKFYVK